MSKLNVQSRQGRRIVVTNGSGHEDEIRISKIWITFMKLHLGLSSLLLTFLVTWAIWITNETFQNKFFRTAGDRWTFENQRDYEKYVEGRFDALPPPATAKRLDQMDVKIEALTKTAANNSITLERVVTLLEEMRRDK